MMIDARRAHVHCMARLSPQAAFNHLAVALPATALSIMRAFNARIMDSVTVTVCMCTLCGVLALALGDVGTLDNLTGCRHTLHGVICEQLLLHSDESVTVPLSGGVGW